MAAQHFTTTKSGSSRETAPCACQAQNEIYVTNADASRESHIGFCITNGHYACNGPDLAQPYRKKSFNRKINKVYQPQCRCFDITPTATKFLKLLTVRFYRKPCFSRIFPYLSLTAIGIFGRSFSRRLRSAI